MDAHGLARRLRCVGVCLCRLSAGHHLMTARRDFPGKVMVDAFKRSGGNCEKCTARLYTGKFAYDHVIADAMGGEPTLENCQVLCAACHSTKTRTKDVPAIAKSKRLERVHIGIKPRSSFRKAPEGSRWDWKSGRRVFDKERRT